MAMKKHNPGCSNANCCGCTAPPTCTLSESGGGTAGGDVNLTWTTTGADTVEVRDQDNTLISTQKNATDFPVTGGACKTYTLTATNACGTTTCSVSDSCPDAYCGLCELGTTQLSYVVQFTYNGVLNACACDNTTTAQRCSQFSGSFTVSNDGDCNYKGGPFGESLMCGISRGRWTLSLKIQQGDYNGGNLENVYGIVGISYSVTDPPSCREFTAYQKLLGTNVTRVDCSVIPGTYTLVSSPTITSMCDLSVTVS